jgi:hemerythrin
VETTERRKIDRHLFRIGVPLIDRQHEQYLEWVDRLFSLTEQPSVSRTAFDEAVADAVAYAIEHFDAEEALMRSVAYPGYEAHVRKHDEFRDETDRLCSGDPIPSSPEERLFYLTRWLVRWFCEQTQVYDKALAVFLARQHAPLTAQRETFP